jgi:hypothetical protein
VFPLLFLSLLNRLWFAEFSVLLRSPLPHPGCLRCYTCWFGWLRSFGSPLPTHTPTVPPHGLVARVHTYCYVCGYGSHCTAPHVQFYVPVAPVWLVGTVASLSSLVTHHTFTTTLHWWFTLLATPFPPFGGFTLVRGSVFRTYGSGSLTARSHPACARILPRFSGAAFAANVAAWTHGFCVVGLTVVPFMLTAACGCNSTVEGGSLAFYASC